MSDSRIYDLITDLKNYLRECKNLGVNYIPFETVKRVDDISKKIKKAKKKKVNNQNIQQIKEITNLSDLEHLISNCKLCELYKTRKKVVFGEGSTNPILMLVGEAPGREEDLTGRPFVGRSGELLTKMLRAINIERKEVFITSVIKCRPPRNRTPTEAEIQSCKPYLLKQIELLDPKLILCLGTTASRALLGNKGPLSKIRGTFFTVDGRKIMVTYHPAFLLRFAGAKQIELKRQAWQDLQILQKEYEKLKKNSIT